MVISFLKSAVQVIKGVVETGIADVDFERVDPDNGPCNEFNAVFFPGVPRRQRYHIACAEYRSGEQTAPLILSHTIFRT